MVVVKAISYSKDMVDITRMSPGRGQIYTGHYIYDSLSNARRLVVRTSAIVVNEWIHANWGGS